MDAAHFKLHRKRGSITPDGKLPCTIVATAHAIAASARLKLLGLQAVCLRYKSSRAATNLSITHIKADISMMRLDHGSCAGMAMTIIP